MYIYKSVFKYLNDLNDVTYESTLVFLALCSWIFCNSQNAYTSVELRLKILQVVLLRNLDWVILNSNPGLIVGIEDDLDRI